MNYDLEKLESVFRKRLAKEMGTRLHAFAKEAILLGHKQRGDGKTLNMFINDAIGFHMTPEQPLYVSPYCYGTADAISFSRGKLRIHDLKTGQTKPSMIQLELYAAYFCLEYEVNPNDIGIELRIYYDNDITRCEPEMIGQLMEVVLERDRHVALIDQV